jgi:hypothetical protein
LLGGVCFFCSAKKCDETAILVIYEHDLALLLSGSAVYLAKPITPLRNSSNTLE